MARPTGAPESSVQSAVFQIEMGRGKKVIQWVLVVLLAATLSLIYTASQFRGLSPRQVVEEEMLSKLNRRAEDPPEKIEERARAAYDEILQSQSYPFRIVNPAGEDDLAAWSDPLAPEPRRVLDEFVKILLS